MASDAVPHVAGSRPPRAVPASVGGGPSTRMTREDRNTRAAAAGSIRGIGVTSAFSTSRPNGARATIRNSDAAGKKVGSAAVSRALGAKRFG